MVTVKEMKDQIRHDLGLDIIDESYVAQPKEFDLKTESLSEKAKKAHKELYDGYVEKLTQVSIQLDTADRAAADNKVSGYRSLKSAEIYNRNAVNLHELYFANISDMQSEISFDSMAFMRLSRDFGTFDDWQWDFIACAKSAQNGWAVAAYDTFLRKYVNFFIDGDSVHIPVGCYPIIVMDVFEHAFFRDYLDDKESYINNMMREFNWGIIEERVERAEKIHKAVER